jgi:SAM-dependent methyltransferase
LFFPERITGIAPKDLVLEVGPGGTAFRRADVYLEIPPDSDEEIASLQRGHAPPLITDRPIIYYDGRRFPFVDQAFDYVICSHVLEHVEDIEAFLEELFRVARRGYIEYPTIYYDYLYNMPVHINLLKRKSGTLLYLRKSNTTLDDFAAVQKLFFQSLSNGYTDLVNDLKNFLIEGFEFFEPVHSRQATSINELVWDEFSLPVKNHGNSFMRKVRRQLSHVRRRRT